MMNWYNVAKFSAQRMPTSEISDHTVKSIVLQNSGNWENRGCTKMLPSYKLQDYRVCLLSGTDVVLPGDQFLVKVFCYVKKAADVVHPFFGEYGVGEDWDDVQMGELKTEEEYQRRWERINSKAPQNAAEYNPEYGHRLIYFRVYLRGRKPQETDFETLGDSDDVMDTPYDVGKYIKDQINRFYFGGGGEEEPEPVDPTTGYGVQPQIPSNLVPSQ